MFYNGMEKGKGEGRHKNILSICPKENEGFFQLRGTRSKKPILEIKHLPHGRNQGIAEGEMKKCLKRVWGANSEKNDRKKPPHPQEPSRRKEGDTENPPPLLVY